MFHITLHIVVLQNLFKCKSIQIKSSSVCMYLPKKMFTLRVGRRKLIKLHVIHLLNYLKKQHGKLKTMA